MGVKGLWRLLLPIGRRISIETLEGKILAIDASIWLTQFLKAMRDPENGSVRPAAHLIGFLRRLCKLRYQGIRPVFIFDGATPEIKNREIRDRRRRREQFSNEGDDAMQRMAKRILVQQLKKQGAELSILTKKGKDGGGKEAEKGPKPGSKKATVSFAPGFFDPLIEAENSRGSNFNDTDKKGDSKETAAEKVKLSVDTKVVQSDDQELIELLEDDDYLQEKTPAQQSDWDTVVIDTGKDNQIRGNKNEKPREMKQFDSSNSHFDAEYVASLPSAQRKDWVEDAKRQQRMTSRREFMKVAYDAEGLSKCQLRNFLRSTKLNKDIQKMALRVVKNEGTGDTVASDRTRRIVFEKETDKNPKKQKKELFIRKYSNKKSLSIMSSSDNDSDSVEWEDADDAKNQVSHFAAIPRAVADDESDSDEEKCAGGFFKAGASTGVGYFLHENSIDPSAPTLFIIDADPQPDKNEQTPASANDISKDAKIAQELQDESLSRALQETDSGEEDNGGGFSPQKASMKHRIIHIAESDDEDDDRKPTSSRPTKDRTKDSDAVIRELQDENLARVLQAAEYSDDEGGGGFLPVDDSAGNITEAKTASEQKEPMHYFSVENHVGKSFGSSQKEDHYCDLVRQRHADSDDESGGGFIPRAGENDSFEDVEAGRRTSEVKDCAVQANECSPKATLHESVNIGDREESDEESDVDWEDGDCNADTIVNTGITRDDPMLSPSITGEAPEVKRSGVTHDLDAAKSVAQSRAMSVSSTRADANPPSFASKSAGKCFDSFDDVDSVNMKDSTHDSSRLERKTTGASPAVYLAEEKLKEESEDEDEVDWEDGDEVSNDNTDAKNVLTTKCVQNHEENPDTPIAMNLSLNKESVIEAKGDQIGESDGNDECEVFNDHWDNDFKSSASSSYEMTAALEHAQSTAANLTNWAGRAFRRAVAQHAQENGLVIPEAAKPKVSSSNQTNDTISAVHKTTSTDAKKPQHRSQVTNQDGNTSGKSNRDGGNEVSSWPESLDGGSLLHSLEAYKEKWAEERNQQERDMDTVTDEMRTEAIQLLQLFGVPYVEAPAEAEAQCVMLEKLGLVDGIVTEDSDAFVFGGQAIFKNIFDDQKYVEVYSAKDAENEMNLTHDGFVALAMLLGGDYTEGVKGVGIVNGMEVLQAFDVSHDLKEGLVRFRKWLDGFDPTDIIEIQKGKTEMGKEHVFHRKHYTARTRWIAPTHFPDPKVLNAYLNPVVDISNERFSWGVPDLERLVVFCNRHMGWSPDETSKMVSPVVERVENGSMRQTRIDSFMRYEDGIKFADVRSKRLREVLHDVRKESKTEKKKKKSKHFE